MNEQNWPADKVKRRSVGSIIPYARNSRTHSDVQVSQIAASINEWGFTNPILIDIDGEIIAGHGRLLAAQKLGLKEVPCITAVGWSDAQKKAYVIADNKLALNAGWDNDMLAIEFSELKNLDFDLDLIGFDLDELAIILKEPEIEGLTDEDAVPDVPDTPITVEGDLWVLGNHRLLCGDSTSMDAVDKLMGTTKADMVFTDPPYGIDYSGGRTQLTKPHHNKIKNDNLNDDETGDLISLCFAAKKTDADVYVCTSPLKQEPFFKIFKENNCNINAIIVWDKKNAGLGYMAYRRQCEFILFHKGTAFHKGDKSDFDLWSCSKDSTNEYVHPTQKPVEIPQRAITNSSKKGDVVLDLFGGSGSTLIACQKIGREARLMELDPKYCDVIVKRWQEFTGKSAVHEQRKQTFAGMQESRGIDEQGKLQ